MGVESNGPEPRSADPAVISGGMGVWISWWVLARIVSIMGGLGVVSGTALEIVHARVLQQGDPGGHIRRAFAELARRQPSLAPALTRLLQKFYIEGGKAEKASYKGVPMWKLRRIPEASEDRLSFMEPGEDLQVLTVAANFAEVWLAKEGHSGKVGINYLRKIERPIPWNLYGAMLAGVDYVVMGAGSPSELPGMIDRFSRGEPASLPLRVYGSDPKGVSYGVLARPEKLLGGKAPPLDKPRFLAIVSSFGLAKLLAGDPATRPYGFIIEGPEAGGHNAPPGKKSFDEKRRPTVVYTPEDKADVGAIAGLGLPFWLAGSFGSAEGLRRAKALGAAGVQVGTVAALSGQSGMRPDLRAQVLKLVAGQKIEVVAEALSSPSGFPFKVAQVPGTLSVPGVYESRKRLCDVGQLQTGYIDPEGNLDFRCPAEPVSEFTRKGGKAQNTVGRVCLCNGLLATAGFGQTRPDGYKEPPIITLGDDFTSVRELLALLAPGQESYSIGRALGHIRKAA